MPNFHIDPQKVDFHKENKWLVSVYVSGRHVHLSQAHVDQLFGAGYQLTPKRYLPHQTDFMAKETINIVGTTGVIEKVRIIGPARGESQVEISRTDANHLGVEPVIRNSGDLQDTPGLILIGPRGPVILELGCIIPRAHIHMTKAKAETLELSDGDKVSILIKGQKVVCYHDILVRLVEDGETEFHMDSDEANAAFVDSGDLAMIKHKEIVIKDNYGNIVELGVDNIRFVRGRVPHDYASQEGMRLLRNIFEAPYQAQRAVVDKLLNPTRIAPNKFYLLTAMKEDTVIGIACFYYLSSARLGYLEHIGIMPEYRNRSIGSFFYHKVTSLLEKEHPEIEGILLEVRKTSEGLDSRKNFFLNLGAIPVDTQFYPTEQFSFAQEVMLMFKPLAIESNLNGRTLEAAFKDLATII